MQHTDIKLITALIDDYPIIQNMARFYVYDRSAYMGWSCPETGLFECIDFKHYFTDEGKHAYLIRVNDELAGFVLLDKTQLIESVDWNMGEFFILAKFQKQGVGTYIAKQIISTIKGKWSVGAMPENIKAVRFWRKVISEITIGKFTEIYKTAEELKTIDNLDPYAMNIFIFYTV